VTEVEPTELDMMALFSPPHPDGPLKPHREPPHPAANDVFRAIATVRAWANRAYMDLVVALDVLEATSDAQRSGAVEAVHQQLLAAVRDARQFAGHVLFGEDFFGRGDLS
jgi:hypothetical protein